MKIAFYKGKSEQTFYMILEVLIFIWTWGKYTHVELIDDRSGINNPNHWNWYSASGLTEGIVRMKNVKYKPEDWDIWNVDSIDIESVIRYFDIQDGKAYDWVGIMFNQFIPLRLHSKDKWFCSEIVTRAIQVSSQIGHELKPYNTSPIKLYKYLYKHNIINDNNKWN